MTNMVWSAEIPAICRETCESRWEESINTQVPDTDYFSVDCEDASPCNHDIEASDMSLQRGEGTKRFIGLLNVCARTETELYSENFSYDCPKN